MQHQIQNLVFHESVQFLRTFSLDITRPNPATHVVLSVNLVAAGAILVTPEVNFTPLNCGRSKVEVHLPVVF